MQISEDVLRPTRPSATVYNILLDLHYSSHPTQPHSIIGNYIASPGSRVPSQVRMRAISE